jgi:hypothetical protein
VADAPDAPDGNDWRLSWLRINLLLREMAHLMFRVREEHPTLKAELNKPSPCAPSLCSTDLGLGGRLGLVTR